MLLDVEAHFAASPAPGVGLGVSLAERRGSSCLSEGGITIEHLRLLNYYKKYNIYDSHKTKAIIFNNYFICYYFFES